MAAGIGIAVSPAIDATVVGRQGQPMNESSGSSGHNECRTWSGHRERVVGDSDIICLSAR